MMSDDEILAVVQAHKEGKKIQFSFKGEVWREASEPEWNFENQLYRVAPEPRKPRELRLVYKGNGTWREWMSSPDPDLAQSIIFREVIK